MTPMRTAAAFLALAMLTAAACSAPGDSTRREGTRRLSIATGGTGGVYYPYGGAIAKVISEQLPGTEATAEVTAASVDNLKFLRDGKADIAFTLADTLADAVGGRGPFQGQPVAAQALAVLYDNYTHVVTLTTSGIKGLPDLKDKAVSTGSPGSGSEVIAFRLLEAAGLNHDTDVRRQGLGVSQSVDALKDGKIQAFFWSGGLPTAAILDLGHTPGITMRLLPNASYASVLQRTYGRAAVLDADDTGVDVSRSGWRRPGRRRGERAGRECGDARSARLRHHPAAVRTAERSDRDPPRG